MIDFDKTKIILASNSPRRRELMMQAGYEFEVIASNMDENTTETKPSLIVKDLSMQKAENVFNNIMKVVNLSLDAYTGLSLMIIGADTIVSKDDVIMGKPKDYDEAFNMIHSLQGNVHQVYTGVSIILYNFETQDKTVRSFHACTDVEVYPMSDSEINNYISTGDCYDKAGSYGIQGPFAVYVKGIHGDYNNVVGLPIAKLYRELQHM
ncbi:Maf family protein [uncultured Eubacterium sp.]|uniref:Maf family protein n=1 Tax=uncultured Eubacterium sp. TaxID=165185 RepID=UPI0026719B01|nr:Maf family protein [uncultured Eubacterium sp.]